jgi:hypothetical protein
MFIYLIEDCRSRPNGLLRKDMAEMTMGEQRITSHEWQVMEIFLKNYGISQRSAGSVV